MTGINQGSFTYDRAHNAPPFTFSHPQEALTGQQIEIWRDTIERCKHPMMVFSEDGNPLLLNQSLREKLSEPSPVSNNPEQPIAFLWQAVCEAAARLVGESRMTTAREISAAFPLRERCIAAVGTILRSNTGQFLGAVLNLADLTGSAGQIRPLFANGGPGQATEESESYENWTRNRDQARQKVIRLSRREKQVVNLVSNGLPNKSIARELDISVKTIEKHRANAMRKLGVSSSAEMVRIAVVADTQTEE